MKVSHLSQRSELARITSKRASQRTFEAHSIIPPAISTIHRFRLSTITMCELIKWRYACGCTKSRFRNKGGLGNCKHSVSVDARLCDRMEIITIKEDGIKCKKCKAKDFLKKLRGRKEESKGQKQGEQPSHPHERI